MKKSPLGTQHLVEFYGCLRDVINNKEVIREAMVEAAKLAKATIVADVFHEFSPHGVSGVVVIAESHIALHSWPEYECVSVDIFSCSDQMDPMAAVNYLKTIFKAKKVEIQVMSRGSVDLSAELSGPDRG